MGFGQVPIGFGQVIVKGKWAFSILSNTGTMEMEAGSFDDRLNVEHS